jgi:hypothetical protein
LLLVFDPTIHHHASSLALRVPGVKAPCKKPDDSQRIEAPGSASFISSISADLADTQQVKVLAKARPVVFNSAIALLQGLFPPNPDNNITLTDSTVVMAPLGGYQYIPGAF